MQRLGELVEGYTKRVHAHSSDGSKGANTRGGGFRAPVRRQQGRLENPCVGKRRHGKEVQFRARLWGRVRWFGVRAGCRAPGAAASGAAAPGLHATALRRLPARGTGQAEYHHVGTAGLQPPAPAQHAAGGQSPPGPEAALSITWLPAAWPPASRLLSLGAPVDSDVGLPIGLRRLRSPVGGVLVGTAACAPAAVASGPAGCPACPAGKREVPAKMGCGFRGCTPRYCPWSAAGQAAAAAVAVSYGLQAGRCCAAQLPMSGGASDPRPGPASSEGAGPAPSGSWLRRCSVGHHSLIMKSAGGSYASSMTAPPGLPAGSTE